MGTHNEKVNLMICNNYIYYIGEHPCFIDNFDQWAGSSPGLYIFKMSL